MSNDVDMNGLAPLPDVEVNAADLVDIADAADEPRTAVLVDAIDEANAADKAAIADLADAADLSDATNIVDTVDAYDSSNGVSIPYIGMTYVDLGVVMSFERFNVEITKSMLELIL